MKIGIACLAYNRPLHLQHWIKQVAEFSPEDATVYIAEDNKNRSGVSFRSNECLRTLKDCDFIFIFNDDCFPIKSGWENVFIEAHKQTGQHHFQFMKESNATKITGVASDRDIENYVDVNIFNNTNGCLLFMTKECVEKVGGFDEKYFYGMEHADYSNRIHRAGLTPFGRYSCPANAEKFIFALDLEPETELHRKLKHKGSMPIAEALRHSEKGLKKYSEPTQIFIGL